MFSDHSRLPAYLIAAALVLVGLCYAPALWSFFSSDDWLMLYHYGQIPPARCWEFFSPQVVWFYRPLQSLQFGILYHLFGLQEVPYNLCLFALHLVVCGLACLLVRELTENPLLAALTTAIFATQWVYIDILLWKSNLNTLQWAAVTLGACLSFSRYLTTGKRGWFRLSVFLCALNFLTKEAAVSAPLLLLLVWLYHKGRRTDRFPRAWPSLVVRIGRDLWPAVLLTAGYIVFHRLFVRDVYVLLRPDYRFAGPEQVVRQSLFAYNHLLLSFYPDPFLLPSVPPLHQAVGWFVSVVTVLPLLLGIWGWRTRDRPLLFGTAWILLAAVPVVFLISFHQSRFYYLPAVGAALVLARLLERAWIAAGRSVRYGWPLRAALGAAAAYMLVVNVALIVFMVEQDRLESDAGRAVYGLLRSHRSEVPRGSLVVLRHAPPSLFNNGIGVREMVRFALEDPRADGLTDFQLNDAFRMAQVAPAEAVFEIDFQRQPLQLRRVPPGEALSVER
jgi:dolichyl-phosphate-mannose-protein mannosyltransferase